LDIFPVISCQVAGVIQLLAVIFLGVPVPISIVIVFSQSPIFTGAAWPNEMPEHAARAAITTKERMRSPGSILTTIYRPA
jgi:hypothetical protein